MKTRKIYTSDKSAVYSGMLMILIFILFATQTIFAQEFPEETILSHVKYNPPKPLPGYLKPFSDENFGNKVTRISDISKFGGTGQYLTHDYSKRQSWNSDQSLIALDYKKILDGNTYELLATSEIGTMGWSNIYPYRSYETQRKSNFFKILEMDPSTYVSRVVFTRTFSDYNIMSHWSAETNFSKDDKYVSLYGSKISTGTDCWVVVYNIRDDVIVSETNLRTPLSNIDWVSMSQSGKYVMVLYNSMGTGSRNGAKSYDRNMKLVKNLSNRVAHGDLGYDQYGNEVWVSNSQSKIRSITLDGSGKEIIYNHVSGGHVSCRNIARPGWAYISDDGYDESHYGAYREIFAVKLDNKITGGVIVNRYSKHYTDGHDNYYHYAKASASPDGTKVLFNSNMSDKKVESQSYPFAFVVEIIKTEVEVTANAGANTEICHGTTTTLTATGGATYVWSTGATTDSIEVSPNETTTYRVTAYDNSGNNSDTAEVIVTVNPLPEVNAGSDLNINSGETATLTARGADSYQWSNGEVGSSINVSPKSTTTYTVTGTTGNCEASDSVTVFSIEASVKANAGRDIEICDGTSTILTGSGGSTYVWSTGATTASIEVSPNETTTYTLTAYDNSGNSDRDEVTVTVNPLPEVDADPAITINSGEVATLTATGASSYKWNTGATSKSIEVRPNTTKTYTVTGTKNGCEAKAAVKVTVRNAAAVIANAGENQNICAGSITTLTASGGETYLWSTGEKTSSIAVSPNKTTTYSVTAYDGSGNNSDTDEVTVTVNPLPTVSAGPAITINSGEVATLTATGASSYKWNTGATSKSIEVRPNTTKTYTVTGTKNGCEAKAAVKVTVSNAAAVIANAGEDQNICAGSSTTLTASGIETYLWSTGEKTSSIAVSPNKTTTYSVTTYDGFGKNSDTDEVTVTVNPLPIVSAGPTITINSGEVATLNATGASSFKWSTGDTTTSIEVRPTTTKTYTVTGTKNGCDAKATVKVTVRNAAAVKANAGEDQNICAGSSTTLTASGGETYLWSTGEKTSSIAVSPNKTTTYSVTAYDGSGKNSDTDEVSVTVNSLPIVSAGPAIRIISGEVVTLTATGASSYKWNTGATTTRIEVRPTATKTYTVTGTKNGCEVTAKVTVTVINVAKVEANAGMDVRICKGNYTTLTASGGDTYLWSTGAITASIDVNPTSTTSYSVTAYREGASSTDEVVVFVNPDPNVVITNGTETTILKGEYITLSAIGASTYKWSNGATKANIAVSPNKSETYSVTGFINECSAERSIKINVLERIKAYAGPDLTICLGERTVLTADGPANSGFLWSTGEVTKSITVSPTEETEYSVVIYNEMDSDTAKVLVSVENCREIEILQQTTDLEFLIHPNPTYGEIKIKISGMTNLSSIHLYDISGKSLYNETINEGNQQRYNKTLDLSDYVSGIYLLQLVDNETVITKKVILK